MRISARQWTIALSAAALVHAAVAGAILWEPPKSGAAAAGRGGIAVSLGPIGGAPGGEARSVDAAAEVATVDPTEAVHTEPPTETPVVEPLEAVIPESVSSVAIVTARPRETSVEVVPARKVAPVEAGDLAPVEPVREVAIRRPIDEAVPVLPEPDTQRPVEPVEIRTVRAAETSTDAVPVDEAPAVAAPQTTAAEGRPSIKAKRAERPVQQAEARPPNEPDPRAMVAPPPPKPKPEPPESSRRDANPETAAEAVRGPEQRTVQASESPENQTDAVTPSLPGVGGKSGTLASLDTGSGNNAPGGGTPGVVADYYGRLQAWLADHKRYPRRAKLRNEQGVALLRFIVTRAGEVTEFSIEKSSGYSLLDEEVREMLRRAQPLPKMPPEMRESRVELLVPVRFFLQ